EKAVEISISAAVGKIKSGREQFLEFRLGATAEEIELGWSFRKPFVEGRRHRRRKIDEVERDAVFLSQLVEDARREFVSGKLGIENHHALARQSALGQHHGGGHALAGPGEPNKLHVLFAEHRPGCVDRLEHVVYVQTQEKPALRGEENCRIVLLK